LKQLKLGNQVALSESGQLTMLPSATTDKPVPLHELSMDEARALVDNASQADCVLQVGDTCYYAHTQLLEKRSKLMQNVLDTNIDPGKPVVFDKMPSTDKYAFRAFLDFLYTGEIPNSTLLAQYGINLAKNAHYADSEELYNACVQYIADNWHEVESMNEKTFAKSMTALLMEDVLSKMRPDALKDRLLFMAAAYNPNIDVSAWRQCVLEQVTSAHFAEHLTHKLLIELYDSVNKNKNNKKSLAKVLGKIPRTTMLAASQKEIEAQIAFEREVDICGSCWRCVTRWQVEHDQDGCASYKHPGVIRNNHYTCCGQIYIDGLSKLGCKCLYKDHHTVSGPFK
jgi:BTB/POZ domain